MAAIRVKNSAGTEVLYNNVDTIVLPTSNGGTAIFRQWNGIEAVSVDTSHNKNNVFLNFSIQTASMNATFE